MYRTVFAPFPRFSGSRLSGGARRAAERVKHSAEMQYDR
jgi:hypothetical protein